MMYWYEKFLIYKKVLNSGLMLVKVYIENIDFVIMLYLIERILIVYVNYECWCILFFFL